MAGELRGWKAWLLVRSVKVLGLFFLSMSTRQGIATTAALADLVCYAYICNDRGRVGGASEFQPLKLGFQTVLRQAGQTHGELS